MIDTRAIPAKQEKKIPKVIKTEQVIKREPDFVKEGNFDVLNDRYLKEKNPSLSNSGISTVFLAWDKQRQLLVVLKEYDPGSEDHYLALETEPKFTDLAWNAGGQRVFDLFEENDKSYLVTYAYVEGYEDEEGYLSYKPLTLSRLIDEGKPIEMDLKRKIINGIYGNIKKLWEKPQGSGGVHWDLKPSNIIVRDGDVFLIDFALSLGRDSTSYDTLFTLPYSSPERAGLSEFSGELLLASETFSFGLIVFQLLFGEHLLETYNDSLIVMQRIIKNIDLTDPQNQLTIEFERIVNNSQFDLSTKEDLKSIFRKVFVKDAEVRMGLDEFVKELNQILSNNV